MAYRKIIRINPYSLKSVKDAIKELETEQKELEKKRSRFVKAVGKAMAKRIEERYGEVTNVNVQKYGVFVWSDGAYGEAKVEAHGKGLFFIEFGTGTLATSGMGWRYGFYPGSWSEDHAKTFQAWASTNNGEPYQYDNEAADAFVRAIGHLDEIVKEAADEVFK